MRRSLSISISFLTRIWSENTFVLSVFDLGRCMLTITLIGSIHRNRSGQAQVQLNFLSSVHCLVQLTSLSSPTSSCSVQMMSAARCSAQLTSISAANQLKLGELDKFSSPFSSDQFIQHTSLINSPSSLNLGFVIDSSGRLFAISRWHYLNCSWKNFAVQSLSSGQSN